MSDDLVSGWSCDQRRRGDGCRDPHGCHCREITAQAHALTEARAEIERQRSCLASSETQYQARGQEVLNEMHRADTAESELSTLRARVREVVGRIIAIENKEYGGDYDEIDEAREIAHQLMEEVK